MRRYSLFVLVGAWLLAPIGGTAQTSSREKDVADFYWRTGHPQSAMFFTQLQEKREKKEAPKDSPKQPTNLDELVAQAMKNNPDVRIADAKVREAEAEAHRMRLRVMADIQVVLAEIEIAKVDLNIAKERFSSTEDLHVKKVIGSGELSLAKLAYTKSKAELFAKESKLPYLLGTSAVPQWKVTHVIDEKIQKTWEQNVNDAKITDDEFIRRATLDILGRTPQPPEIAKFKALPEATRRRQLLDELIQCAWTDTTKQNTPITDKQPANKQLAEALKNNPDLRIAEAKVREAEAEFYRTRIRVMTELQGLYAEIEAADLSAKEGLIRWESAKQLFDKKSISRDDLSATWITYAKLRAKALAKQARLPYLLGNQTGMPKITRLSDENIRKALEFLNDAQITDDEFIRRAMLDILGRTPQPQEIAKFKALPDESRRRLFINELFQSVASPAGATRQPAGVDSFWIDSAANEKVFPKIYPDTPMKDKLRKALDTPIKLKVDAVDATELLDQLHNEFTGVNLQVRYKAPKNQKVTINFREPVPKGAFLQCLEDELRCVFILRDYGIVVVPADDKLPPGAIRVTDFWKQRTGPIRMSDLLMQPRATDVKAGEKTSK